MPCILDDMSRYLYLIYDGKTDHPIQATNDAAALNQARRWLQSNAERRPIDLSIASVSRSLQPGSRFLAYLRDLPGPAGEVRKRSAAAASGMDESSGQASA